MPTKLARDILNYTDHVSDFHTSEHVLDALDIDTQAYGWKSPTFLANISGAVQYGAVSWQLQDSPNNSDWTAVDSSLVLFTLPSDHTTTSKVFTAGYIGKERYVKATFTSRGAETGQITVLLGHGMSQPVWQSAYADLV